MQSKHLFVKEKLSLTVFTSFGFAQNTLHDFRNTVLPLECHCLRQMSHKPYFSNPFKTVSSHGRILWKV